MVIGGAEIYAQALPLADLQVISEIHLAPEGDAHYPPFDQDEWREVRREPHQDGEVGFDIVWWERLIP
jgi:dihydrofolate reductase